MEKLVLTQIQCESHVLRYLQIYHILPLQMILLLAASTQIWMSIYEQKCLYFNNALANETVIISYNTVEP